MEQTLRAELRMQQSAKQSMLELSSPRPTKESAMSNNEFLNRLSRQLAALVPMAEELRADLRTNMEQLLHSSLNDLDILSRSEFEAQNQALQRAQQRVQDLEIMLERLDTRLSELEAQSKSSQK